VHGFRAQSAVKVFGQHAFMGQLPGGKARLQSPLGVAAKGNVPNHPVGIGERRRHGVDAKYHEGLLALGAAAGGGLCILLMMPVLMADPGHGALRG